MLVLYGHATYISFVDTELSEADNLYPLNKFIYTRRKVEQRTHKLRNVYYDKQKKYCNVWTTVPSDSNHLWTKNFYTQIMELFS